MSHGRLPRVWQRQLVRSAVVLGCALLLSITTAAGQPAQPASGDTDGSLEHASAEISLSASAEVHTASDATDGGGLDRTLWLGAAAALFLLIAGAAGANDKRKKKH